MKRPPPKSRVRAEKVRVVIRPTAPNQQQGYAEPPGYSSHNGGQFDEAGYRSGIGTFGFRQDVT